MADVAPWVERLARVGYAAKALLYITVGLLAAQAAWAAGGRPIPRAHSGWCTSVTFGRVMLLVVAAGLMGYAVWRVVEAVVDPDGRGTRSEGVGMRASSAGRGIFHGA